MERAPARLAGKGKSAAAKHGKKCLLLLACVLCCIFTDLQAGQNAQILHILPGLPSVQQQSNELMAAVQSLESSYHAAHADLLADWPTALESPVLKDELPKLQGTWYHWPSSLKPET